MGDRYTIQIKCARCGKENEHWHAPSSGYMSFTCECGAINWVSMDFVAREVTKEEEEERYKMQGFE